ncbi:winged helix-turn-helix transcriptional regulator [Candidatus Giovannonibacteria bacterium]|nr:winged helix-turn-helix transcriptional regulator [Candidatus Giovannonibacteria bacterium]
MKNQKDLRPLEKTLKALSNKRRLGILSFLKKSGEASVGDIAEDINLSFKATSKHLGILFSADIVERAQRSLQMLYSISADQSAAAKQILYLL